MPGPTCSMLLADFGADVIKVEPPNGEIGRNWGSVRFGKNCQLSGLLASLNRHKSSIAVDLKNKQDLEQVHKLITTADVVLENFRPGVVDRLNIG